MYECVGICVNTLVDQQLQGMNLIGTTIEFGKDPRRKYTVQNQFEASIL